MRGFFKALFDFFWPYFAAGFLAGTLMLLVYGLSGAIKFPEGTTTWQWLPIWFVFGGVMTAFCAVVSIVFEVFGFVVFMIGAAIVLTYRHLRGKGEVK